MCYVTITKLYQKDILEFIFGAVSRVHYKFQDKKQKSIKKTHGLNQDM